MPEEDRTGDELTQELEDAWNLYTRVGTRQLRRIDRTGYCMGKCSDICAEKEIK